MMDFIKSFLKNAAWVFGGMVGILAFLALLFLPVIIADVVSWWLGGAVWFLYVLIVIGLLTWSEQSKN